MTSTRARRTINRTTGRVGGVALGAIFLAGFGLAPSTVQAKAAAKVAICHATSDATNPYIKLSVPVTSLDGHGKNDHTSHTGGQFDFSDPGGNGAWGDIIPAAEGVAYSLNATEAGLGTLANGCNGPGEGSCPDGSVPVGGQCPTDEVCEDGSALVDGDCPDELESTDGGSTDGGTDGGTDDAVVTDDGGSADGGSTDGGTDGGTDDAVVTDDGGTTDGGTDGGATTGGSDDAVVTDDGGSTDGGTDGGTDDAVITDDAVVSDDGGTTDGGTDGGATTGGSDEVVVTDDGGSTDGGDDGGATTGSATDGGSTGAVVTDDAVTPRVGTSSTSDLEESGHSSGVEVQGDVIWGATAQHSSSLPVTGAESLLLAAAGVVLVTVGFALAIWARLSRA